ncbi:50S ribosomal protein L6 [Candidatus Parcubacteria bacterium]|nr:MAG: 50S ribosomal protein L6 [Candidatus Parcubacteria bacterium]
MSRLAKKPISIPSGVTIEKTGSDLKIKGPRGERSIAMLPGVDVRVGATEIKIGSESDDSRADVNMGTMWSLIKSALLGATSEFVKTLEIEGVGYRAAIEGNVLVIHLGYVQPVRFPIPQGAAVGVEKNTIRISGIDKDLVGRIAAQIRALKKPEPYKSKGIRYQGEVIQRKVGKKAGAAATGSAA